MLLLMANETFKIKLLRGYLKIESKPTRCTLWMMRVLLLVCADGPRFRSSRSLKAESVTPSPPFVKVSIQKCIHISTTQTQIIL